MPMVLASLICGLIFGVGLVISGMTQPARVLGFLDVLGQWDPTLLFVMAGAVIVSGIGFFLTRRRAAPLFAPLPSAMKSGPEPTARNEPAPCVV